LDNATVGQSKPGGFFYIDTIPGGHLVSTATEVERELTFSLDPGESKYVRTSTSLGLFVGHVTPELVSPDDALLELQEMSYIGTVATANGSGKNNTSSSSPATPTAAQSSTEAQDSGATKYQAQQPQVVETIAVTNFSPAQPETLSIDKRAAVARDDKSTVFQAQQPQANETVVAAHVSQTQTQTPPAQELSSVAKAEPANDAVAAIDMKKIEFKLGLSSYTVEKIAKQHGCESKDGAGLITENGPVEVYRLNCQDGSVYLARCELRQCAPMQAF